MWLRIEPTEFTIYSQKYRKAKQITTEPVKIDENKPLHDIEEIVPKREPPGLERAMSRIVDVVPLARGPNEEAIAQYILNKKKALITKKKEKCRCWSHQHYQKLINKFVPVKTFPQVIYQLL